MKKGIDKGKFSAIIPIKPIEIIDLETVGGMYIWILVI